MRAFRTAFLLLLNLRSHFLFILEIIYILKHQKLPGSLIHSSIFLLFFYKGKKLSRKKYQLAKSDAKELYIDSC